MPTTVTKASKSGAAGEKYHVGETRKTNSYWSPGLRQNYSLQTEIALELANLVSSAGRGVFEWFFSKENPIAKAIRGTNSSMDRIRKIVGPFFKPQPYRRQINIAKIRGIKTVLPRKRFREDL